jgi:hypothetical protein
MLGLALGLKMHSHIIVLQSRMAAPETKQLNPGAQHCLLPANPISTLWAD